MKKLFSFLCLLVLGISTSCWAFAPIFSNSELAQRGWLGALSGNVDLYVMNYARNASTRPALRLEFILSKTNGTFTYEGGIVGPKPGTYYMYNGTQISSNPGSILGYATSSYYTRYISSENLTVELKGPSGSVVYVEEGIGGPYIHGQLYNGTYYTIVDFICGTPKPSYSDGTITVIPGANGQIKVGNDSYQSTTFSQNYAGGTELEIYAQGIGDYVFDKWSDGDMNNPRTILVDDDADYTAQFVDKNTPILTFDYDDKDTYINWRKYGDSDFNTSYMTWYGTPDNFVMVRATDYNASPINHLQLFFWVDNYDITYNGTIGPAEGIYTVRKAYVAGSGSQNNYWFLDTDYINNAVVGYDSNKPLNRSGWRGDLNIGIIWSKSQSPYCAYAAQWSDYDAPTNFYGIPENSTVTVERGKNDRAYVVVKSPEDRILFIIGNAKSSDITLCENCDNAHYNTFKDNYNGETVNVTYNRQFKASKWSTMCLPFSLDLATMIANKMYGRVYEFKYATGNANVGSGVNLYFSNAKSIEAGKCYIVNANAELAAKTSFVFSGVTIDVSADKGEALNTVAAYNRLDGYKSQGTIELVGTLRNGTLQGSATGNKYMGLKENKIYYPNTDTGSTIWAYRGIFRSTSALNVEKMRIIVDGEDRGELLIDADGELLNASGDAPSRKFIRDGVLYIEREGVIYDAQGKRIE